MTWDQSAATRNWLRDMERGEPQVRADKWSTGWITTRSMVIAQAREGDPERLQAFVQHDLGSDELEAANLNYWAYWIDAATDYEHSDDFMAGDLGQWSGVKLLRGLYDRLRPSEATIDLCIHSLWALLERRPWILRQQPALTNALHRRVGELQSVTDLSAQARRELQQVQYGIRVSRSA